MSQKNEDPEARGPSSGYAVQISGPGLMLRRENLPPLVVSSIIESILREDHLTQEGLNRDHRRLYAEKKNVRLTDTLRRISEMASDKADDAPLFAREALADELEYDADNRER